MAAVGSQISAPQDDRESPTHQRKSFFTRYFGQPGADETYDTISEYELESAPETARNEEDDDHLAQALRYVTAFAVLSLTLYMLAN